MAQRQFKSDDTSIWQERFGNGSDGAVTYSGSGADSTPNTTFTGTAAGTSGTAGSGTGFAANNLVLIHQSRGTGVGAWELNKISSVGGGTNWTMVYDLMNTYSTGAQVYLLKQYSAVTVNSGVTLTSLAWTGTQGGIVAFLCNGTVTVTGTITGAGKGFLGADGENSARGNYGEGSIGASGFVGNASNNGSGGGGGDERTGAGNGGGGGGNASAGTNGTAGSMGSYSGNGGDATGVAALTTMFFGGGGGRAGGGNGSGGGAGGQGATGGGLALIIAKNIVVTGSVSLSGNNGTSATDNNDGGGGGGAGGSILFKGQSLTLGSTLVTASAGSGGGKNGNGGVGGAGSAGRIHADYSGSISGTTSPTLDSSQSNLYNDAGGAALFGAL